MNIDHVLLRAFYENRPPVKGTADGPAQRPAHTTPKIITFTAAAQEFSFNSSWDGLANRVGVGGTLFLLQARGADMLFAMKTKLVADGGSALSLTFAPSSVGLYLRDGESYPLWVPNELTVIEFCSSAAAGDLYVCATSDKREALNG